MINYKYMYMYTRSGSALVILIYAKKEFNFVNKKCILEIFSCGRTAAVVSCATVKICKLKLLENICSTFSSVISQCM